MRFVPVKSEEVQGAAMIFRVRELLIRPRIQAINALRGHLTEFGQIVPQGAANASKLIAVVEDPESGIPADAITTLKLLVMALAHLETEIGKLNAEIARRAKENDVARRLMTVPDIGPLIATAIAVLAPPLETFRKARDFAAWLGLVPRQHSTGGKQRLSGARSCSLAVLISTMAQRSIVEQKRSRICVCGHRGWGIWTRTRERSCAPSATVFGWATRLPKLQSSWAYRT